jgi:hypothetical protein
MIASYDPTDGNLDSDILVANSLNPQRQESDPEFVKLQNIYHSLPPGDPRKEQLGQYLTHRADPLMTLQVGPTTHVMPRSAYLGGGQQQGEAPVTAINPQTGQRIQKNPQTGQWEPIEGGAGQQAPQTFPGR